MAFFWPFGRNWRWYVLCNVFCLVLFCLCSDGSALIENMPIQPKRRPDIFLHDTSGCGTGVSGLSGVCSSQNEVYHHLLLGWLWCGPSPVVVPSIPNSDTLGDSKQDLSFHDDHHGPGHLHLSDHRCHARVYAGSCYDFHVRLLLLLRLSRLGSLRSQNKTIYTGIVGYHWTILWAPNCHDITDRNNCQYLRYASRHLSQFVQTVVVPTIRMVRLEDTGVDESPETVVGQFVLRRPLSINLDHLCRGHDVDPGPCIRIRNRRCHEQSRLWGHIALGFLGSTLEPSHSRCAETRMFLAGPTVCIQNRRLDGDLFRQQSLSRMAATDRLSHVGS